MKRAKKSGPALELDEEDEVVSSKRAKSDEPGWDDDGKVIPLLGNTGADKKLTLPLPVLSKFSADTDVKIVTWNVNGLRACIKSNGFNRLQEYVAAEAPDVICIQETKVDADSTPRSLLSGFEEYYSCCTSAKGYAGTAVFTRLKPLKVTYGLGSKEHDDEGRLICIEFAKVYLVTTYVPNAGAKLERLSYRVGSWDKAMQEFLQRLQQTGKRVIWCGDLNVAATALDLSNPKTNQRTAGFTKEERQSFSKVLNEANLVDSWRHLNPNRRQYTFFAYRSNGREKGIGWRLDYFVLSKPLIEHTKEVFVRESVYGSDHLPLGLVLPKHLFV